MNTRTFVDPEAAVRDWLKNQITGIGDRVFLSLPERVTLPAVDLLMLDGGIDSSEAPLAHVLFTFSAWGRKGNRPEAAAAIWSLASVLNSTQGGTLLSANVAFMGAQMIAGPSFRPDPDGTPRYVLDAALTLRSQ